MVLREIEPNTLDEFVKNSAKPHFMETSAWGEVCKSRGNNIRYLGLFDNDELKGVTLAIEKKVLCYNTFYCPRGFIVNDYKDKELLKSFINALKNFSKKNKGLYIKIDPDLIIRKLDDDANPIYIDEDNLSLIDFFKQNGGTHKGFTTNFIDTTNPRFTFRVDLTQDDLLNSFHKTTKKILEKNNPYNISIYKGTISDIDKFYDVMKNTSIKKKMYLEPKSFFSDFYEILNKHKMSDLYIASININQLKDIISNQNNEINEEIDKLNNRPDTSKKENLLNELLIKKEKILKELKEVNEIKEDNLVLSSIITSKFKDTVWTIHGGNAEELKFLNANYEIYYQILKDAKKDGYKVCDFFGSEGKVDKTSDIYGIYLFKLRFGGDFVEFIGEFDFITNPFMNKVISTLINIRRNIRYKKSIKENKNA